MFQKAKDWSELNRDYWMDFLRMFMGLALFLKGIAILRTTPEYAADLAAKGVPFAGVDLVNLGAATHFVGGTMLVFGLLTRVAAAIQIPTVLSAIVFIHSGDGVFSKAQGLELAILTLAILVVLTFVGSGRMSTDWYFSDHPAALMDGERVEMMRLADPVQTAKGGPSTTDRSSTPPPLVGPTAVVLVETGPASRV